MKSEKRRKMFAAKRARKERSMQQSGGNSRYARKRAYLHTHDPDRVLFGADIPEPKPWK